MIYPGAGPIAANDAGGGGESFVYGTASIAADASVAASAEAFLTADLSVPAGALVSPAVRFEPLLLGVIKAGAKLRVIQGSQTASQAVLSALAGVRANQRINVYASVVVPAHAPVAAVLSGRAYMGAAVPAGGSFVAALEQGPSGSLAVIAEASVAPVGGAATLPTISVNQQVVVRTRRYG